VISVGHDARSRHTLHPWCGLQRPHVEVHCPEMRVGVVANSDLAGWA